MRETGSTDETKAPSGVPTESSSPHGWVPVPGARLARYEIRREIGRGGMAIVYEAFQPSLNRSVALKVLPPQYSSDADFVSRFHREAQAAARLHHPNIIPVYDVGEENGIHYFAMECIDGETMAQKMSRGVLPQDQVLDIAVRIADGLEYAHELGVVHRDIKPGNIMITSRGRPVLMDFGLAWLRASGKITVTGAVMGSPVYMSPEQASGKETDCRTDIYSLGVVLYEALSGTVPFEGSSSLDTLRKVVSEEPPLPRRANRRIPRNLEAIVLKAMAKKPGERYKTAREFKEDILRFREGRTVRARHPDIFERFERVVIRRHRVLAATFGTLVIVGGLSSWVYHRAGRQQAVERILESVERERLLRQNRAETGESLPGGGDAAGDLLRFGDRLYDKGEYDRAAARYREVITSYPGQPAATAARYKLALSLERLGDFAGAEKLFREVLHSDKAQDLGEQAGLHLARTIMARGRTEESLEAAGALRGKLGTVGSALDLAYLYREIADRFREDGKAQRAIACYTTALDISRQLGMNRLAASCQLSIAECWTEAGRWQEAMEAYRGVVAGHPDETVVSARALVGLAIALLANGMEAEAEDVLRQAASMGERADVWTRDMARFLAGAIDLEQFERIANGFPVSLQNDASYAIAIRLDGVGDAGRAREYYQRAMDLSRGKEWPFFLAYSHFEGLKNQKK